MHYAWLALNWILVLLFGLLAVSMFLMGNTLRGLILGVIVLLLLPPVRNLAEGVFGRSIPGWVVALLIVALLAVFLYLFATDKAESIYKSPEHEARLMEIYDARLEAWPVPYESIYIDTEYGQVHVIATGPEDAPPLLLLHASAVSGVSWLDNIEEVSKHYRTYALDTIGDAGRSVLRDVTHYPQDGQALSDLVAEVSSKLGVERAYVVGASQGGLIATNYALHAPDRVEKVVLLGPMGYAGTNSSVLRILLATFFPLGPVQDNTVRWAFGDDPAVLERYGDWLRMYMDSVFSQQARPTVFSTGQLQSLEMPVLLVLGQRDNLVGDPENARKLVEDVPQIQVGVVDTGHLLGVEHPEEVNALIIDFFEQ